MPDADATATAIVEEIWEKKTDPIFRYFNNLQEWRDDEGRCALLTDGFCVLPSVLTDAECNEAVDLIWEFINDTSCGRVRRETPSTWYDLLSSSDDTGMFLFNGAGWLLSNVRVVLAERVFEPLFGTRELHASKEGFVFRPPASLAVQGGGEALEVNSRDGAQGKRRFVQDYTSIPVVRSMLALMDHSDEDSFVCYPKSFVTLDPRLMDICEPSSQQGAGRDPQRWAEAHGLVPKSVRLRKGDVLVWRSDLVYTITPSATRPTETANFSAIAFCSMQPARFSPSTVIASKMGSYKQRQTGDYRIDVENLFASQNPVARLPTRSYFRLGPPQLTHRQAKLYGLLQYRDCGDLEEESINRALIRGVRFNKPESLPTRPAVLLPCDSEEAAHLVHLTADDKSAMAGQDKYLGGMASPCGKYVFGVPGGAKRVMRIRVADGHLDFIGPSYAGSSSGCEVSRFPHRP